MALGLPLEECLCVDDDILRLSSTALEKLMKRWLKSLLFISIKYCSGEIDETMVKSLLFIFEYIFIYCTVVCWGKTCMLENNS